MAVFFGVYQYKLDAKGRLFLPPDYRAELKKEKADSFFVTTGLNKCLYLFLPSQWETLLADNMQAFKTGDKEQERAFKRFFFGNAAKAQVDAMGRILISPQQRQYCGLEKEAVVVGVGNKAEIWNSGEWAKYNKQIIAPNAARFSKIYDI